VTTPSEQKDILAETLPRRFLRLITRRRTRPARDILVRGFVTSRVRDARGNVRTPWHTFPNGATYVGLNKIGDSAFRNQAAVTQWYCGLIQQAAFSAVSISDTMASHAGWTEEQQYGDATRPPWSPAAAALGVLAIGSAISLQATAEINVRGIFVASSNTKGEAASVLWATAVDGSARNVPNGEFYEFFYSVAFAPSN
jgi:hypothetical protein